MMDRYLTLSPTGVEPFVMQSIKDALCPKYKCHRIRQISNHHHQLHQYSSITSDSHPYKGRGASCTVTSATTSSSENNGSYHPAAELQECVLQQQRKKQMRKSIMMIGTTTTTTTRDENKNKKVVDHDKIFGTVKIKEGCCEKEVNIGFHPHNNHHHHHHQTLVSYPGGGLEGKSLIVFDTDAPPKVVASIRSMGCGPLLALIDTSACRSFCSSSCLVDGKEEEEDDENDVDEKEKDDHCHDAAGRPIIDTKDTLTQSLSSISSFFLGDDSTTSESDGYDRYKSKFDSAVHLWARHAVDVWLQSVDVRRYLLQQQQQPQQQKQFLVETLHSQFSQELMMKIQGKLPIKFRVSCLRSNAGEGEYLYKRDELIPKLADLFIPNTDTLVDGTSKKYVVDLCNYDLELVTLIHNGAVTIGISLNYYQHVGARSFCSGKIPPDITIPYIMGDVSKTVIRLRPSIANLLYDISQVQVGDVVLDPCAGVGTIPIEGAFRKCVAFGGDLVTCMDGFHNIVTDYHERAKDLRFANGIAGVSPSALAWDAALMPIRENSVDCILSDLPFGVRCMSSKKLHSFLPLLFGECARCLRTTTGKMTILCGSFQVVLDALNQINEENELFESPTSIIPVNIGGLSAWIIQLKRTGNAAVSLKNHRKRAAAIIRRRYQTLTAGSKRLQA